MAWHPGLVRDQWGERHHNWKGGRKLLEGYVMVYRPEHPRASKRYVLEHRVVAEQALGHLLPAGAVIHHINGIKTDNRPRNLVVLAGLAEHISLHMRLTVLRAGGNPWTQRLCTECGPQDRSAFSRNGPKGVSCRCRPCRRRVDRERYALKAAG